jgi:hypothetical protein
VTKPRSLPIAGFQPITHSENYFATLTNFLAQRKIIASVSYHANPADIFRYKTVSFKRVLRPYKMCSA